MSEENVSLPVAQALASALAKIEAYVPTEYVDNSEPDLNAEHLNHAEQGIMRVTNLLNAAVDVIQGQESRLADAETKIGTAALTGGMTDLSSGLNALNSNIECNNVTVQSAPGTIVDKEITFKTPFDTVPKVIVSIESDTANSNYGKITAFINNRSKTGFVIRLANASENNLTPALTWLAVAK